VAPQSPRPEGEPVAYVTGGAANKAAMTPAFSRFGYANIEIIDV
jgi:hypothetical protein